VAYLAADKIQVQMTPEDLRQILFYDVGEQAAWRDRAGRAWMLYYFAWHNPRAAQLGGVHVPERCLPAVGWVLERQDPNLTWARAGVQLVFNCFEFNAAAQHIFVFYCQWDPSNYPYADKTGRFRADRLSDAWLGERMAGKRQLEMALVGMPSLEEAELHLREFLDAAIAVPPNGGD
jgi:hypothetical protein